MEKITNEQRAVRLEHARKLLKAAHEDAIAAMEIVELTSRYLQSVISDPDCSYIENVVSLDNEFRCDLVRRVHVQELFYGSVQDWDKVMTQFRDLLRLQQKKENYD